MPYKKSLLPDIYVHITFDLLADLYEKISLPCTSK